MKIAGNKLEYKAITDVVVFQKGGEEIVFTVKAVIDEDIVDKLVPEPVPPSIRRKGDKEAKPDLDDQGYLEQLRKVSEYRICYRILESLSATEGLEWETVNREDPTTWMNWEKEMMEAGFSQLELDYLVTAIIKICGMSVVSMDAARADFLALMPVEGQPQ
jgi:hypothetical protein|tara:strand:- start:248 stop:730 length:483 start_codon:yes stop_codon:yes gene_type:complete